MFWRYFADSVREDLSRRDWLAVSSGILAIFIAAIIWPVILMFNLISHHKKKSRSQRKVRYDEGA